MAQLNDLNAKQILSEEMQRLRESSAPYFELFFNKMMNLTWMSFVCEFFGFQYLADIAYTSVTKKN